MITPWNFPLAVPIWKAAPALVAGNVLVWKPSRLTPSTAGAIALLFSEAGLPAGALNIVNGSGRDVGRALVEHPDVRAISFTSSYEVATQIYADAAVRFKKVQCEAGGKNAVIVCSDADIDRAASAIVEGAFKYAGQRCTSTSRVIVVEDVANALVEALVDRARSIVVGNGLSATTQMGPLADDTQLQRVEAFIERGRHEGELVCGGSRMTGQLHRAGWFVPPTIFDRVAAGAVIAQEEIFGPVIAIVRVHDFSEAVTVANSTRYGMTTSVFTRDVSRLLDSVDRLQCGVVHLNSATTGGEVQVPFGGIKDTGVGEREMGSTAIDFYTELKVVYVGA